METKELKIEVPKGYEIDKEKSTFEKIVFKKKEPTRWRDNKNARIEEGYYLDAGKVEKVEHDPFYTIGYYDVFATEKQAKSSLAMAQISQIMANDERFGGVVTDKEWETGIPKFTICRYNNEIGFFVRFCNYEFLSFHTEEQCDLFLEENEDLVKDYLMID